jgi:hypothetical protein
MSEYKLYNILSDIDKNGDYSKSNMKTPDPEDINYLHDNYHNMDINDKYMMLRKLVPETQINAILLRIEMANYEPTKKVTNLEDFMKLTNKILTRYQHKAGGFRFEDDLWLIGNRGFDIILSNSLSEVNYDRETTEYMEMLTRILNKLSDNINVKFRFNHARKDRIIWAELVIKDDNLQDEQEENIISL